MLPPLDPTSKSEGDGQPSYNDAGLLVPDRSRLALTIQQPWAELILRGIKTLEVRTISSPPHQLIYLYTSRKVSRAAYAGEAMEAHSLDEESLPLGVVVGTVEIVGCHAAVEEDAAAACVPTSALAGKYCWELAEPRRCPIPLVPRYTPFGMWFYPFLRQGTKRRRKNGN